MVLQQDMYFHCVCFVLSVLKGLSANFANGGKPKMYVFGGSHSGTVFNDVFNDLFELDLNSMKWRRQNLRDTPEKRFGY